MFPEPTVIWNEVEAPRAPSETKMVMMAVPERNDTGVTVMVRLAPEPPSTMFASAMSVWSEDAAARLRLLVGVSRSLMMNGRASVAAFCSTT